MADDTLKRLTLPAFFLGFALSGFFDGILLHQVLQWHHLLSGVGGDLRFQVLADGYFHVLMYLVAALALWGLWLARASFDRAGASRYVLAMLLIGFGVWHFVDAVASHWLLGIHRIRMDSDTPLLWDIGWLIAFGAVPLALGLMLRRKSRGAGGGRGAIAALVLLTFGAGAWASQKPPGQDFATIVFAPGVSNGEAFARAGALSEGVVWFEDGVVVVQRLRPDAALELYRAGAIFVSGGGMPPGCIAWTR